MARRGCLYPIGYISSLLAPCVLGLLATNVMPYLTPAVHALSAITPVLMVTLPLSIGVFAKIYRCPHFPSRWWALFVVCSQIAIQLPGFYRSVGGLHKTDLPGSMSGAHEVCGLYG
jgi:hypothetical protein